MSVIDIEVIGADSLVFGDKVTISMFDVGTMSVKHCIYTGPNWLDTNIKREPDINEIRLFDNGYWMLTDTGWKNVTNYRMIREIRVPDSEIPFCDFDNILEEEVEASECL